MGKVGVVRPCMDQGRKPRSGATLCNVSLSRCRVAWQQATDIHAAASRPGPHHHASLTSDSMVKAAGGAAALAAGSRRQACSLICWMQNANDGQQAFRRLRLGGCKRRGDDSGGVCASVGKNRARLTSVAIKDDCST